MGNNGAFPEEPDFFDDNDDQNDPHDMNHTGGEDSEEGEYGDQDAEDDLDDDMMDKISSSPSIDDGKYTLPVWPSRSNSSDGESSPSLSSTPPREAGDPSSSPFTSPPQFYPLPYEDFLPYKEESQDILVSHEDGYVGTEENPTTDASATTTASESANADEYSSDPAKFNDNVDKGSDKLDDETAGADEPTTDLSLQDIQRFLLPVDDPLLDNVLNDNEPQHAQDDADSDDGWEDLDETEQSDSEDDDEDDDEDCCSDDPRFIDSGWGGNCLLQIEDIDFEFVYALHTFVATVEGQANATKGDTMVLLDDSNSYWWLVRVVKDGSIGANRNAGVTHMMLTFIQAIYQQSISKLQRKGLLV